MNEGVEWLKSHSIPFTPTSLVGAHAGLRAISWWIKWYVKAAKYSEWNSLSASATVKTQCSILKTQAHCGSKHHTYSTKTTGWTSGRALKPNGQANYCKAVAACKQHGNWYVERWWGFSYLKKFVDFLVYWFQSFLVSWFQSFLVSSFRRFTNVPLHVLWKILISYPRFPRID